MRERPNYFYVFGPFRVDMSERCLLYRQETLQLTPKQFDLLLAFLQNGGHILTKNELMDKLWPDTFVEEATLTRNISRLRKLLSRCEDGADYIETIPRQGYRFVVDVAESCDNIHEPVIESSPISHVVTEGAYQIGNAEQGLAISTRQPAPGDIPWRKLSEPAPWAIMVLAIAVIIYFNRESQKIDSLAVLTFINASLDPDSEYLCDEVTESLINRLARLPGLTMISRHALFPYERRETDLQTIASRLKVKMVLRGRVIRRGEELMVATELVDTGNNRHLWGELYRFKLGDLSSLREEIVRRISADLQRRLANEE